MSAIPLANVLLGLAKIGTDVGISVSEQEKIDELDKKVKTLNKDITTVGNFYDHIYYPIVVNIKRLEKALDKLPNNLVHKIQKVVIDHVQDADSSAAIETVANILGYIGDAAALGPDFLQIVVYLRNQLAEGDQPGERTPSSFEMVPVAGSEVPEVPVNVDSSLPTSSKLDNIETGLNVAAIVFGLAGLAATIALGVWTLDSLNNAISDVNTKQAQITAFYAAMKKALDPLVKSAKFSSGSYAELARKCVPTWRKSSQDFESYEKEMYHAIHGYFMKRKTKDVKNLVEKETDKGTPYPETGYPIAETLAKEIRKKFKEKKSDKEIVVYFAKHYSDENLRFVFDEYFISSLRPYL